MASSESSVLAFDLVESIILRCLQVVLIMTVLEILKSHFNSKRNTIFSFEDIEQKLLYSVMFIEVV